MPIIDHRIRDYPPCSCCGEPTRASSGVVELGWDPSPVYFARWNPNVPAHGIALLIGLGHPSGFVSAMYSMENEAITIIGPADYDWQSDSIEVLERSEVMGTPLATKVFRVIDEIWMHDPEIQAFASGQTITATTSNILKNNTSPLLKSNIVGAACLCLFALSFLFDRSTRLGLFEIGAMLFWSAAAWMLVKRPRGFGLPVAILAFGSVALQFYYIRISLAQYVADTDIRVSPELWARFWISVTPLILGGIFATLSFCTAKKGTEKIK